MRFAPPSSSATELTPPAKGVRLLGLTVSNLENARGATPPPRSQVSFALWLPRPPKAVAGHVTKSLKILIFRRVMWHLEVELVRGAKVRRPTNSLLSWPGHPGAKNTSFNATFMAGSRPAMT
jgi:hypothetical protein